MAGKRKTFDLSPTGISILDNLKSASESQRNRQQPTAEVAMRPKSIDRLDPINYGRKMQVYNKKLYAMYMVQGRRSGLATYKLIEQAMEAFALDQGWITEKIPKKV